MKKGVQNVRDGETQTNICPRGGTVCYSWSYPRVFSGVAARVTEVLRRRRKSNRVFSGSYLCLPGMSSMQSFPPWKFYGLTDILLMKQRRFSQDALIRNGCYFLVSGTNLLSKILIRSVFHPRSALTTSSPRICIGRL